MCLNMRLLILSIIVIFASCNDRGEYFFDEKGSIEYIDYKKALDIPPDDDFPEIPMRNYNYLKSIVNTSFGKFNLYVFDINENLSFNDFEDAIFIDFFSEKELKHPVFSNRIQKNNHFSINNKAFTVSNITKDHKGYKFKLDFVDKVIDSVEMNNRVIDVLPDKSFLNYTTKETVSFKKYLNPEKYTYIEFWATWCSPCVQKLPKIKKINEKYKTKLNVVSIHSEKAINYDDIDATILKYKMNWNNGISNEDINNSFNYDYAPAGYLFDSNGNLIMANVTPTKIDAFFKNMEASL